MIIEIRVPAIAETIKQVQLAGWLVEDGQVVDRDQEIAEIDSDKATLAIAAAEGGKIRRIAAEGDTLEINAVICEIDTDFVAEKIAVAAPTPEPLKPAPAADVPVPVQQTAAEIPVPGQASVLKMSPLARKLMQEAGLNEENVVEALKNIRLDRHDMQEIIRQPKAMSGTIAPPALSRDSERKKMTTLRLKLSERLVRVKNETAMLTTFNEVNMSAVLDLKKKFSEKFKEKHGISFGLMSFFTKACALALKEFPAVNAQIDGDELIFPSYVDMGIAVSAPKGLVVPVVRNAESLTLAEIEQSIKTLAGKARNNRLSLEEMTGGTFTITNGGVFGSMMSTPILNPPQSGILGLHNIIERPVAMNGQVVIQPMMYIALSYDHRVIDGRESVSFLVRVKEMIENPARLMFDGKDPYTVLLDI